MGGRPLSISVIFHLIVFATPFLFISTYYFSSPSVLHPALQNPILYSIQFPFCFGLPWIHIYLHTHTSYI
jgi:hypothetical protein